VHHVVAALILRDLRRSFRRVLWAGPAPMLPPGPVVAYANHQSLHDGHLLWLVARRLLGRRFLVWMEEADRFPFFALQGALPFPRYDDRRRAATIRRTRRLFRTLPGALLAYFPEGELHPADEAVREIPAAPLQRLHRALGEPCWWPIAIHQTWRGDALPVALLGGGPVSRHPPTTAHVALEALRRRLRDAVEPERMLLDGRPGPHERWSFAWMRRMFRHRPGGT
jgi:1-acyl-sn-glycerol-3-phosphate acyltransferase